MRYGAFDQVENFIVEKSQLLHKDQRDNAINFNMARLHFYKKDFDAVIECLNKVTYEDVFYAINSKMLLQASYYENKEFDALESSIDAFIRYLQRDKSVERLRVTAYMNFCKLLRRFILFKEKDYDVFIEKIKETKPMYNKAWLLQKVEAYKS